eukprot:6214209-Pleurochrysis_carterae.AAC.2
MEHGKDVGYTRCGESRRWPPSLPCLLSSHRFARRSQSAEAASTGVAGGAAAGALRRPLLERCSVLVQLLCRSPDFRLCLPVVSSSGPHFLSFLPHDPSPFSGLARTLRCSYVHFAVWQGMQRPPRRVVEISAKDEADGGFAHPQVSFHMSSLDMFDRIASHFNVFKPF